MTEFSERIRKNWFEYSQANDKIREIEELVKRYPSVINIQDRTGRTAIFIATTYKNTSVLKKLLELKADPTIPNNVGRTPLIEASNGSPKCHQILTQYFENQINLPAPAPPPVDRLEPSKPNFRGSITFSNLTPLHSGFFSNGKDCDHQLPCSIRLNVNVTSLQKELEVLQILEKKCGSLNCSRLFLCPIYSEPLQGHNSEILNTSSQVSGISINLYYGLCLEAIGPNLQQILGGPSWITETLITRLSFFEQILEALSLIHTCGFCYYNLHPLNVISSIGSSGAMRWKLTDFGNCCEENVIISRDSLKTSIGFVYLAPESLVSPNAQANRKNDIWSLGLVGLQILKSFSSLPAMEPPQFERMVDQYFHDQTLEYWVLKSALDITPFGRKSAMEIMSLIQSYRINSIVPSIVVDEIKSLKQDIQSLGAAITASQAESFGALREYLSQDILSVILSKLEDQPALEELTRLTAELVLHTDNITSLISSKDEITLQSLEKLSMSMDKSIASPISTEKSSNGHESRLLSLLYNSMQELLSQQKLSSLSQTQIKDSLNDLRSQLTDLTALTQQIADDAALLKQHTKEIHKTLDDFTLQLIRSESTSAAAMKTLGAELSAQLNQFDLNRTSDHKENFQMIFSSIVNIFEKNEGVLIENIREIVEEMATETRERDENYSREMLRMLGEMVHTMTGIANEIDNLHDSVLSMENQFHTTLTAQCIAMNEEFSSKLYDASLTISDRISQLESLNRTTSSNIKENIKTTRADLEEWLTSTITNVVDISSKAGASVLAQESRSQTQLILTHLKNLEVLSKRSADKSSSNLQELRTELISQLNGISRDMNTVLSSVEEIKSTQNNLKELCNKMNEDTTKQINNAISRFDEKIEAMSVSLTLSSASKAAMIADLTLQEMNKCFDTFIPRAVDEIKTAVHQNKVLLDNILQELTDVHTTMIRNSTTIENKIARVGEFVEDCRTGFQDSIKLLSTKEETQLLWNQSRNYMEETIHSLSNETMKEIRSMVGSTSHDLETIFDSRLNQISEILFAQSNSNSLQISKIQEQITEEFKSLSSDVQHITRMIDGLSDLRGIVVEQLLPSVENLFATQITKEDFNLSLETSFLQLQDSLFNSQEIKKHFDSLSDIDIRNMLLQVNRELEAIKNHQIASSFGAIEIPFLYSILPETIDNSSRPRALLQYVKGKLRTKYELYFLCNVCGAKGSGYTISVTKEWVKTFAAGLKLTLIATQLATTLVGLPIPCLGMLVNAVNTIIPDIAEKVARDIQDVVSELGFDPDAALSAMESSVDIEEVNRRTEVWKNHRPLVSLNEMKFVKTLLVAVGDPSAERIGLDRITCPIDASTTWVCQEGQNCCVEKFRKNGASVLLVNPVFS